MIKHIIAKVESDKIMVGQSHSAEKNKIMISLERLPHNTDLPVPFYASIEAAGADLCAAIEDDVILKQGQRILIPTGFKIALPKLYEAQIRPRSGLALKYGVTVLNSPGTIDSDYRGEIKILLINHGEEDFTIHRGDRIAQMVIAPVTQASFKFSSVDVNTVRGEGGYGSTGLEYAEGGE